VLSWRGFLRRRPLIQNHLKDFFGSLPKQRRDLVRNNPRNAVLLGATMGATVDNILQISFYYHLFENTIR
jgi:hypothetical protein